LTGYAQHLASHLGEFHGAHHRTPWNSAIQESMADKWLQLDRDQANLRWFDYLGVHPTTLTYYFAHCWEAVHKLYWRRCRDERSAEFVRPWRGNDPMLRSTHAVTCLWRARQTADSLSCRYPVFLNSCYKTSTDRGWGRMPQPNHMYSEAMLESALDAWENEKGASIQWPTSPQFRLYKRGGYSSVQRRFIVWLCNQIRQRESKIHTLATALTRRHLSPEIVAGVFGSEQLKRAQRLIKGNRK